MTATRRLAAILAADVAGYSRLIGADEEGTLNRLRSIRAEVIDPRITECRGRIVKTTGDGLLVEFASVVDALRCATEIQTAMAKGNAEIALEKRIEFRMGINMGDVVVEDGDIFGDGVNVAARLEGLADPGGICVSARVQEDAAGKLDRGQRPRLAMQFRQNAGNGPPTCLPWSPSRALNAAPAEVSCVSSSFSLVKDAGRSAQPNETRGARLGDPVGILDISRLRDPQPPVECLFWVISGCAGPSAARQVNLKKRTPRTRSSRPKAP